jgi:hypothetical protein
LPGPSGSCWISVSGGPHPEQQTRLSRFRESGIRFCNRYKGSDVATIDPASGLAILLFHPRTDRWDLHFPFVNSRIEGYTPSALATIRILRLNDPERVAERDLILSLPCVTQ